MYCQKKYVSQYSIRKKNITHFPLHLVNYACQMAPRGGIELPRGKAPQAFQACALAARLPRHADLLSGSSKNGSNTDEFARFLRVQKNLSDASGKNHLRRLNTFLKYKKTIHDL